MSLGLLGKDVSDPNADVILYTAPTNVQMANLSINIANNNDAAAKIGIFITTATTGSDGDALEPMQNLEAAGVLGRDCVLVGPGENVILRSDSANVAGRVMGIEQQ